MHKQYRTLIVTINGTTREFAEMAMHDHAMLASLIEQGWTIVSANAGIHSGRNVWFVLIEFAQERVAQAEPVAVVEERKGSKKR